MPSIDSLTPELWAHIFLHCHEKGEEGVSVAQPTLVNLLTANKTFFDLAGRVLYRRPVVTDICRLLTGAYDSKFRQSVDQLVVDHASEDSPTEKQKGESRGKAKAKARVTAKGKGNGRGRRNGNARAKGSGASGEGGESQQSPSSSSSPTGEIANTKLPLLQHVRHLTIVPMHCGIRTKPLTAQKKVQEDVFQTSHALMYQMTPPENPFTPKLESISIGSCQLPHDRSAANLRAEFDKYMMDWRLPLLRSFRPKTWCEYDNFGDAGLLLDEYTATSGLAPVSHEIHTGQVNTARVVWGTTNRVILRHEHDFCRTIWPKLEVQDRSEDALTDILNGEVDMSTDSINAGAAPPAEDESIPILSQEEEETIGNELVEIAMHSILQSISTSVSWWIQPADRMKGIDNAENTIFEFYGLEKLFNIRGDPDHGQSGSGELASHTQNKKKTKNDTSHVDTSSYTRYIDSRCTPAYVESRNRKQAATLQRIENRVRSELQIDENGRWQEFKVRAPTIRLFLASQFAGCPACGQGKDDEWAVDDYPFPDGFMGDDSDDVWVDEDDFADYQPGMTDDDIDNEDMQGIYGSDYGYAYDDDVDDFDVDDMYDEGYDSGGY